MNGWPYKRNAICLITMLVIMIVVSATAQAAGRPAYLSSSTRAVTTGPLDNPLSYTVTDLGPAFFPAAINNNGQVADEHARIWDSGQTIDLGYGTARDINDVGQVVGVIWRPDAADHDAFVWQDADGNGQSDPGEMQFLGGVTTHPLGINNSGQIVGFSKYTTYGFQAFLWQDGNMTNLGTFGTDTESSASAINDGGQVTGWSYMDNGEVRAFRWQNGQMSNLGALGDGTMGHDINEQGQILGLNNIGA